MSAAPELLQLEPLTQLLKVYRSSLADELDQQDMSISFAEDQVNNWALIDVQMIVMTLCRVL